MNIVLLLILPSGILFALKESVSSVASSRLATSVESAAITETRLGISQSLSRHTRLYSEEGGEFNER
jgi:hypothetical protein